MNDDTCKVKTPYKTEKVRSNGETVWEKGGMPPTRRDEFYKPRLRRAEERKRVWRAHEGCNRVCGVPATTSWMRCVRLWRVLTLSK